MTKRFLHRLTALLAAVFLICTITSCQSDAPPKPIHYAPVITTAAPTQEELYTSAQSLFENAKNLQMQGNHRLHLEGVDPSAPPIGWTKTVLEQWDLLAFSQSITENDKVLFISYVNGVLYDQSPEGKFKANVTLDELNKLLDAMQWGGFYPIPDLPESCYERVNVTENDGEKTLQFTFAPEEIPYFIGDERAALSLGEKLESVEFTEGNFTVTLNEDGFVIGTQNNIALTVVYDGNTYHGVLYGNWKITYGLTRIATPDDADSYTDLTGQLQIPE